MNEGRIRTIVLGIFLHEDRLLVFRGDDPARDVVFTARSAAASSSASGAPTPSCARCAKNWALS